MYKALKPFPMSGANYLIGDVVDVSKITEKQIDSLIKRRYIVKMAEGGVIPVNAGSTHEPLTITVPIIEKDSTLEIVLPLEQMGEVFTILQKSVDDAAVMIHEIESEEELIVIHQLDSRKGVQKAAKDRAEELAKEAEAQKAQSLENANGNGDNTNPDANGDNPDSNGSGEE